METEAIGAAVASVARRHDTVASMIFRWRVQFGFGKDKPAKFATMTPAVKERKSGTGQSALVLHGVLPIPEGMAAVDLPDGRRVFAPSSVDPDAVRRHLLEREAAR